MNEDESDQRYVLPKHLRFVRSLALLSGVAIGVSAGATLFIGCDNPETQPCHVLGVCVSGSSRSFLGATKAALYQSQSGTDGGAKGADSVDSGVGGGPLPAPPLPRSWLS